MIHSNNLATFFRSRYLDFSFIYNFQIARDPETGKSKGHGFISFDNFDSSDSAIEAMNGNIHIIK